MELKCQYSYFNQLYICNLTEAAITEPNTQITAVNGEHRPGKNNKGVEKLAFTSITIHFFPRGLDAIYPHLKALTINLCGLKTITRDDLAGLENLEILDLNNNQLVYLPSNLFLGMTKLKNISINSNKLECFSSKVLKPIEGNCVTTVSFKTNTKINSYYTKGDKAGTQTLQDLMEIIDKSCGQPDNDGFNRDFVKQKFQRDFFAGLENMWKLGAFSDFKIIAGEENKEEKEFAVHKCVLAMQSSVFAAAFATNMKEKKEGLMVIEDFSPESVEGMLHFMYTGEMKDDGNAMDIFALASKYDLSNLKSHCENIILSNIDSSNAAEIFDLGHLYHSDVLKDAAFEEIKPMIRGKNLNLSQISKQKNFLSTIRKIQELHQEIDDLKEEN